MEAGEGPLARAAALGVDVRRELTATTASGNERMEVGEPGLKGDEVCRESVPRGVEGPELARDISRWCSAQP